MLLPLAIWFFFFLLQLLHTLSTTSHFDVQLQTRIPTRYISFWPNFYRRTSYSVFPATKQNTILEARENRTVLNRLHNARLRSTENCEDAFLCIWYMSCYFCNGKSLYLFVSSTFFLDGVKWYFFIPKNRDRFDFPLTGAKRTKAHFAEDFPLQDISTITFMFGLIDYYWLWSLGASC